MIAFNRNVCLKKISPKPAPTTAVKRDVELEKVLVAGLKAREEGILEKICAYCQAPLRGVIFRVLKNQADVDDVLQEVLMEAWQKAESYSSEKGAFLGWISTLARRRAIDRLRQKLAYQRVTEKFQTTAVEWEAPAGPGEHKAQQKDLNRFLNRLLRILPEEQRNAISLAFFRSMTHREIAAATSTPTSTVKTRIELGLRKLARSVRGLREQVC